MFQTVPVDMQIYSALTVISNSIFAQLCMLIFGVDYCPLSTNTSLRMLGSVFSETKHFMCPSLEIL